MTWLRDALDVARQEASLFRRYPKLRVSVVGIIVIPALYAWIYLTSVWDPASLTQNLPVAIVNLDQGTRVNGQAFNIGADLVRTLRDKRNFGFHEAVDADRARAEVRSGQALFALIVPASFSAQAMSASAAGAGKLIVFASEGNNYAGAGFARRFADQLGHQLNETLNEKRWAAVLGSTASASGQLQRLRDGVGQLRQGAAALDAGLLKAQAGGHALAGGAGELSGGVQSLTGGMQQLGSGLRTLESKSPAAGDLKALREGARQLAEGQAEMLKGVGQLEDGAQRLHQGALQMREQTQDIPLVGGKVAAGAQQLADGARQLTQGLDTAGQAQARLAAGTTSLSGGVMQLTEGFGAYAGAVSTLVGKLPADAQLHALADGGQSLAQGAGRLGGGLDQLKAGSGQLLAGLDTLASSLPAGAPTLNGTAQGLATSVAPVIEIDAPVQNNGMGLAPNFIPVALWIGAVMTAFIFHLRRLPEATRGYSRVARMAGKLGLLGSINLAQAACVLLMVWLALGLQPAHVAGLALTMGMSSLAFMLVILLLVRVFGDAGKAVALILMILQLSSAGGIMPTELTSDFYRTISPWLPFTWSVQGVRASAFDAFGGDWTQALGVLVLFAAGAFTLALWAGQWKYVAPEDHRPAMDI